MNFRKNLSALAVAVVLSVSVAGAAGDVPKGDFKVSYKSAFLYLDTLTYKMEHENTGNSQLIYLLQAQAVANVIYDNGNSKARKALANRGWETFGDDGACCVLNK